MNLPDADTQRSKVILTYNEVDLDLSNNHLTYRSKTRLLMPQVGRLAAILFEHSSERLPTDRLFRALTGRKISDQNPKNQPAGLVKVMAWHLNHALTEIQAPVCAEGKKGTGFQMMPMSPSERKLSVSQRRRQSFGKSQIRKKNNEPA